MLRGGKNRAGNWNSQQNVKKRFCYQAFSLYKGFNRYTSQIYGTGNCFWSHK
jgi:hypothetical protein